MAKNLINGTNIIVEENGDNINMNLSSSYNTNLQQEINNSFKNNNIYSTSETVVGKWIDGKPIYRKVINSTKANIQSLINNLNIDTPIRFDGLADSKYGYTWAENVRYTTESGYSNVYRWSQTTPRKINWEFEKYYENNNPVMVILEYTKTTDVAP